MKKAINIIGVLLLIIIALGVKEKLDDSKYQQIKIKQSELIEMRSRELIKIDSLNQLIFKQTVIIDSLRYSVDTIEVEKIKIKIRYEKAIDSVNYYGSDDIIEFFAGYKSNTTVNK